MFFQKAILMDSAAMDRSLMRISHEILERNTSVEDVCLVGIYRRGCSLARQIGENLKSITGSAPALGELDIRLYRDDLEEIGDQAAVSSTKMDFDVSGKVVVLVDDVLYTGRTARAAIEAVMDRGRPAAIQLAVLVDRGHRELPIRADFVGKNVPTSRRELVEVRVPEFDGAREVALLEDRG